MTDVDEDFGEDFIVVTDEDGNEYELRLLDELELDGETYAAFATAETADEDEVEVVVFKVVEEDGEELYEAIEDEAELERVYTLFMERLEDGEDYDEDDEDDEDEDEDEDDEEDDEEEDEDE
jgi:hypothetical protein